MTFCQIHYLDKLDDDNKCWRCPHDHRDLTEDSEPTCDYCGGEVWDNDDLENGKCKMCIVNACQHIQSDIVSYDVHITHYERHITTHEVCMDCEVCWTVRYQLDNGNKSKYTHEDVNTSDIDQD